jgi:hypothetical protein
VDDLAQAEGAYGWNDGGDGMADQQEGGKLSWSRLKEATENVSKGFCPCNTQRRRRSVAWPSCPCFFWGGTGRGRDHHYHTCTAHNASPGDGGWERIQAPLTV